MFYSTTKQNKTKTLRKLLFLKNNHSLGQLFWKSVIIYIFCSQDPEPGRSWRQSLALAKPVGGSGLGPLDGTAKNSIKGLLWISVPSVPSKGSCIGLHLVRGVAFQKLLHHNGALNQWISLLMDLKFYGIDRWGLIGGRGSQAPDFEGSFFVPMHLFFACRYQR